jgi:hypothetical protein
MKHFQNTLKRLPLVIRNKFLKEYIQILNLLESLLIIYFILTISGCIDLTGPGKRPTINCGYGVSKSVHFYPFNEQDPPSRIWLERNVRNYAYVLSASDVCTYLDANGSMFVFVDTGAVNEGLTISGKAKGSGTYEKYFNISFIHSFNGQSKFSGSIIVDLIDSGVSPAYCSIYVIIKFPTKGSEQQDLNYLYSKVFDVNIGFSYYKRK